MDTYKHCTSLPIWNWLPISFNPIQSSTLSYTSVCSTQNCGDLLYCHHRVTKERISPYKESYKVKHPQKMFPHSFWGVLTHVSNLKTELANSSLFSQIRILFYKLLHKLKC